MSVKLILDEEHWFVIGTWLLGCSYISVAVPDSMGSMKKLFCNEY